MNFHAEPKQSMGCRSLLFSGFVFFGTVSGTMAQVDNNTATQSAQMYNPVSSGNDDLSNEGPIDLSSPAPGLGISRGNSKISGNSPGEARTGNQLVQLSPAPSGIALSPGGNRISTNDLNGASGMNPLTSPGLNMTAGPGSSAQGLPAASREAGDKKWLLLFNVSTGITYDDNIFISHTHKEADEIFTVSGGFSLGLGDFRNLQENYLLAQYVLSGFFFVHNSQENAPGQELALKTQFRFSKLTLQTTSRYEYLSGVNREVGNFVNENLIDNLARLNYDYSDKTQFFLSFEQITNLYENFINSYEYIGRLGGTYQVTSKIRLGGEAVFGRLDQDQSPSSNYTQLRLLADYALTGKLSFNLSAGAEIRHYDSGNGRTNATPVFSLGLIYHPFPDTSIGVSGYRNVNASPSAAGENYVATGVALQFSQSLFQRLTVGLSGGYENDTYRATESGAAEGGREDNYFFIQPTLTYKFREWLSASLSYEFRRNSSNESGFMFSDNRITFSINDNF
jgi:putative beta-barrel porin BBP2